ncbi:hypothetical protein OG241_06635 [Streptomyces sp. NBC_01390]|uniref:hypothetical protein n=1 Tax=Streptomyces sp. NBC_01390 TaxID=2903850 RepID=UPI00324F6C4C
MTDLTGGRALSRTFKTAKWGLRTWTQRQWFKYLIQKSVLWALLMANSEAHPQQVREAASIMRRVLMKTPISRDPEGFSKKLGQLARRWITRGVRYPDFRGPERDSFQDRLREWALDAAKTERGKVALDYAQFPASENRAEAFARNFQLATGHILNDPTGPPTDAQNYARDAMLREIEIGLTAQQIQGKSHNRNAVLRSIAAGATGAAFSGIGLHGEWYETASFAIIGATASATVDYTLVGTRNVTQRMVAARRKALAWLLFLMKTLLNWRESELPSWGIEEGWREYLPRALEFMVTEENETLQGMLQEMETTGRLNKLIETAERAADEDLSRLLTEVETALEYNDLHDFPDAVGNLIYLLKGVSPKSGGYSRPEIAPGERPPQLPRIPDELEGS